MLDLGGDDDQVELNRKQHGAGEVAEHPSRRCTPLEIIAGFLARVPDGVFIGLDLQGALSMRGTRMIARISSPDELR